MAQMIADAVSQAGANFVDAIQLFLPRIVTTFSIILAGWMIAVVLRTLVRWMLGWLRFNTVCDRAGHRAAAQGRGPAGRRTCSPATVVFWLVWIGFLLSGVDVLGFTVLAGTRRRRSSCSSRGCWWRWASSGGPAGRQLPLEGDAAGGGQRPRLLAPRARGRGAVRSS